MDPENPKRRRSVVTCRTADRGKDRKTFKDSILQTCSERNDAWSRDVQARVLFAISDLHAADAQYHEITFRHSRVIYLLQARRK